MTAFHCFLLAIGLLIGLPILAYMVVKFGTAGFFKAREINKNKNKQNEK